MAKTKKSAKMKIYPWLFPMMSTDPQAMKVVQKSRNGQKWIFSKLAQQDRQNFLATPMYP